VLSWVDVEIFDNVFFFNVMKILEAPKDVIMIFGKKIDFKDLTPFFFEFCQRKFVKKTFNIQTQDITT